MVSGVTARCESESNTELQQHDMREPLLLVSNYNDWGKNLEAAHKAFLFTSASSSCPNQRECWLELNIQSKRHLSFQIISAKRLWGWRIHPARDEKESKELKCSQRVSAHLSVGGSGKAAHGLNFRVREAPPISIEIRVACSRQHGIMVWYERTGHGNAVHPSCFAEVPPWQSHAEVGCLRLVGGFCHHCVDVQGLTLKPQETSDGLCSDWRRHQLCIRLQYREIKFQIISDRLGYEWRLCPKRGGSRSVIPKGDTNDLAVTLGRKKDGHGRKYFRIRENYLVVVVLSVWMEIINESAVGRIYVTYTIEDMMPDVAIGPHEIQFPPKELSALDLMVQKIAQNPRILDVVKDRLRAVVNVVRRELNTRVVALAPPADMPAPPAQRVAAMLMLLPSALAGWPNVFHTYLHYHLLSPTGPRFAHVYVFVDEPPVMVVPCIRVVFSMVHRGLENRAALT